VLIKRILKLVTYRFPSYLVAIANIALERRERLKIRLANWVNIGLLYKNKTFLAITLLVLVLLRNFKKLKKD
jgi:hypothetical protein